MVGYLFEYNYLPLYLSDGPEVINVDFIPNLYTLPNRTLLRSLEFFYNVVLVY